MLEYGLGQYYNLILSPKNKNLTTGHPRWPSKSKMRYIFLYLGTGWGVGGVGQFFSEISIF